jgi:hypothetical protein
MRKLLIPVLLSFYFFSYGQEDEKTQSSFKFQSKNAVEVEIFGHGLYYSINYERFIINGSKWKTSGQIGFSYYPPATGMREIWIPVLINELYSFNQHHIELGIGHIFINETIHEINSDVESRMWDGFMTARLGYRYQKPDGRFLFRIGFTPIIEYTDTNDFHPLGGISFGYNF